MDLFSFPVLLLLFGLAGGVGYLAATVAIWGLHRRAYNLECAVTDLEDKILVEIKKRAGQESGKSRKADSELFKELSKPKEPDKPWWMKYATNPELREQ